MQFIQLDNEVLKLMTGPNPNIQAVELTEHLFTGDFY
jgi:hypothetical protein